MLIIVLVVAAAFVALVVVGIVLYNTLVGRSNEVEFAFASIDAMLKKRWDLIPNLVSATEKYMEYERGVLDELTALRAGAMAPGLAPEERMAMENTISTKVRGFFALAENYPQLKANASFLFLQSSLNEVEEQLAASRRTYNAAVTVYNNGCRMFPSNIVARYMNFNLRPWFQVPEEERAPVTVWR